VAVDADYHAGMYLDALEFLEDEREAWAPYEVLADLTDAELSTPVAAAHGWSGRDLMAHMLSGQTRALDVARELAMSEVSPTIARIDADWATRGDDAVNAEITATWAARPLDELRETYRSQPGELRGTLTVVPEARWIKHPTHMRTFDSETIDHYAEHQADLAAVLRAAGR
jgi:Mycothiol maleylpyruvate isomerase N-terminal domain